MWHLILLLNTLIIGLNSAPVTVDEQDWIPILTEQESDYDYYPELISNFIDVEPAIINRKKVVHLPKERSQTPRQSDEGTFTYMNTIRIRLVKARWNE